MDKNRVFISGNLTRDAEEKVFDNGNSAFDFAVAVNGRKQNGSGEWEDVPNYFDCVTYSKSEKGRNFLAHSLLKGARVDIEGKLKWESWTDRDGNKRSRTRIVVLNMEVVKPPKQKQQAPADTYDDDLPF